MAYYKRQRWWFSGKIDRCQEVAVLTGVSHPTSAPGSSTLSFDQPRVRFPADASLLLLAFHEDAWPERFVAEGERVWRERAADVVPVHHAEIFCKGSTEAGPDRRLL